ncbi:MAG: hypothetical protein AAF984_03685 [Verrucomicrobiota bacterium]
MFNLDVRAADKKTSSADGQIKFAVGNMKFLLPEEWQKLDSTSPLRSAHLIHRDEESGQKIDIIFFYFGHQFNSKVYENMDEWRKQFITLQKEEMFLGFRNDKNVYYLQVAGTYNRGLPGGTVRAIKDSGLLGAIIEDKRGNIYVKMSGPAEMVEKSKMPFRALVEGKTIAKIEEEIKAVEEAAQQQAEKSLADKSKAGEAKKKASKSGGH